MASCPSPTTCPEEPTLEPPTTTVTTTAAALESEPASAPCPSSQPLVLLPSTPFSACARPDIAASLPDQYKDLGPWTTPSQLPVVYSERYNITFFGIEKLHPFDACKYRKVVQQLGTAKVLQPTQLVTPLEVSREVLLDVHTPEYVQAIHSSNLKIVQVTELPPLLMLPNPLLQWKVVRPLKVHVAGTMLAAGLALQHGWAINLGGGMHHAYSSNGMGWCPFDDVHLAVRRLRRASGGLVRRMLYVDCDAHQGNGVERDKITFKDDDMFILDLYNSRVFPRDDDARPAMDIDVPLQSGCGDELYLRSLRAGLQQAFKVFRPDLVFYNAGTDILAGDPLGRLAVSEEGVVQRDEMVWEFALQHKVPLVMVLSGGYSRDSAGVISKSITNLFRAFGLNPAGAGATGH